MFPGNLYLADELIFQFRGLTQFNYIHLYIKISQWLNHGTSRYVNYWLNVGK